MNIDNDSNAASTTVVKEVEQKQKNKMKKKIHIDRKACRM